MHRSRVRSELRTRRLRLLGQSREVLRGAARDGERRRALRQEVSQDVAEVSRMVHAGRLILLALTASSTSSRMIHIPAAKFIMGHADASHADEAPEHEVELSPFEI